MPVYRHSLLLAALLIAFPAAALAQVDLTQELPSLGSEEAPSIRVDNMSIADGLSQSTVYSFFQDTQGFIWFGTQGGLHRYDGQRFEVFESVPFDTTSIADAWVLDVNESEDGSLWMSTFGSGLDRLDPETGVFHHMTADPADSTSLPGNWAVTTFEDQDGRMWVGTTQGMARMDEARTGVFEQLEHEHDDSTTVGSRGVHQFMQDPRGMVWAAGDNGLTRIDPKTLEIENHHGDGTHNPREREAFFWRGITDRSDPNIFWYGTGRGLVRFDTRTTEAERWVAFPEDPVGELRNSHPSVAQDPNKAHVIWVGSDGGGMLRFDALTETFSVYQSDPTDPNGVKSNSAQAVFADRTGTMWVGYRDQGLGKFNPSSVQIAHISSDPERPEEGIPAGYNWALHANNGRLWIGVAEEASGRNTVVRLDLRTGSIDQINDDPDNPEDIWHWGNVASLTTASDGRLWVGTAGLASCDPDTLRCRRVPRPDWENEPDTTTISTGIITRTLHAIYEAPDAPGILWVGPIGWGLQRYDMQTGAIKSWLPDREDPDNGAKPPGAVADILLGSDGALWIGTLSHGLVRFERETETFERFSYDPSDSTGVSGNQIETVLERAAEPGVLWLGTNKGLNRFDMATRTARHFGKAEGMPDTNIYGILEAEDGQLWISTNKGITAFDPETETFRNYGLDDGLRELEFMQNGFTMGDDGMLYFGDVGGVTAFHPAQLTTNPLAPGLAFTELRIGGEAVTPRKDGILSAPIARTASIELPYAQNGFAVDFVALHFSDPSRNQYRYILDGYDDEWIDSGFQHTAAYTNLPPGNYTLRVMAANPDGVWNEAGITLGVSVLPPWYRTAWAYLLFAGLLVGTVVGGGRIQRSRVRRQERARAEIQEVELRAEAAESEAKALAAENDRKKNIERLSEIGKEITASLDFETIFGRLYEHVNELTDAPIFGVGVYNSEQNEIEYRMAIEDGKRYAPYTRDASDKDQLPVWCMEHRKPVFINDLETEYREYIQTFPHEAGTLEDGTTAKQPYSMIYLPLTTQDRVLGVITVQSFEKDAYSRDDLNLLQTMAAYASVALDNANAYRQLNGTVAELRQTQEQLVQQEKMASLGQLTAGIAHEIKNPLNFVTNFADVNSELATELRELLAGGDTSALADRREEIDDLVAGLQLNARQISKHGKRADDIVKGMMEHARPGNAERFSVSVNDFIEEYVNLAWHGYRARFPDSRTQVQRDYGEGVGNAKIAPQEMGRVIINLVGNALDVVRDRADGHLRVSTAAQSGSVEIRIADNGTGVPEHLKTKIFEPFFTTKPTGEGTGLGLSMSHDIVTQGHSGTMKVEDNPDGGATFVITIPA